MIAFEFIPIKRILAITISNNPALKLYGDVLSLLQSYGSKYAR